MNYSHIYEIVCTQLIDRRDIVDASSLYLFIFGKAPSEPSMEARSRERKHVWVKFTIVSAFNLSQVTIARIISLFKDGGARVITINDLRFCEHLYIYGTAGFSLPAIYTIPSSIANLLEIHLALRTSLPQIRHFRERVASGKLT